MHRSLLNMQLRFQYKKIHAVVTAVKLAHCVFERIVIHLLQNIGTEIPPCGAHVAAASKERFNGAFVVAGYIGHPNTVAQALGTLPSCFWLEFALDLCECSTTLSCSEVRAPHIFVRDLFVSHRHLLVESDECRRRRLADLRPPRFAVAVDSVTSSYQEKSWTQARFQTQQTIAGELTQKMSPTVPRRQATV